MYPIMTNLPQLNVSLINNLKFKLQKINGNYLYFIFQVKAFISNIVRSKVQKKYWYKFITINSLIYSSTF